MTDFATSAERLLNQVRHWDLPRWRGGRAERTYVVLQLLADLAADAEGRPRRAVPRESPVVIPDQLRVLTDDLLAAGPPAGRLAEAAAAVDALRASL